MANKYHEKGTKERRRKLKRKTTKNRKGKNEEQKLGGNIANEEEKGTRTLCEMIKRNKGRKN